VTNDYLQRLALPASWTTETDAAVAETVGRWATTEVMRRRTELEEDRDGLLVPAARTLLEELGLRHLVDGGEAGSSLAPGMATTVVTALEQVGRADTGIAFGLAGTYALHVSARTLRRPRIVEALRGGDEAPWGTLVLPGFGASEEGFDGLCGQVAATRKGRTWLLDGAAVRPQFGGHDADLLAVFAALKDGAPGVLVVPRTADGIRHGAPRETTGLAFSRSAELTFRGVRVPDSMVLCRGADACGELVTWSRLGCAAAAAGAALAGYEILDDWAENRVIKGRGQPFKGNALVAATLGEIGAKLLTARLQLHGLAQLLDESDGPSSGSDASARHTAAIAVSREVIESSLATLDRGMELMASAGYATEWNLERYWRDVRTLSCLQGSATHARTTIARHVFGTDVR
jgi:alkylation response protein AidB-like acyl-CoA dehydrogenase